VIEVKNVSKKYGKKTILEDVSFTAKQGDCIGILGLNGSGKSTLLAILAGMKKVGMGEIFYYGKEAVANEKIFASYTGYVPQDNPLIEELSVYDNLHLWYAQSGKDIKEMIKSGELKQFGLEQYLKMPVKKLSGGMKKRLSIACALVNIPKILILDEPSVALDLPYKRDLHEFIKSYVQQGGIVIVTTHDVGDLQLCNKIYLLKAGRLQATAKNNETSELIRQLEQ
jgi:ABC-type multidrug transport system, ATPase component